MTPLLTSLKYTIAETIAKKSFIAFLVTILAGLGILGLIVAFLELPIPIDQMGMVPETLYRQVTLEIQVASLGILTSIAILFSIFVSGGILPSALEKGTAELLLSKPVKRRDFYLGRITGAFGVVAFNLLILVAGVFLITSLKFGIWNFGFLMVYPMVLLAFLGLYAIIAIMGVVTRSSIAGMLLAYLIFVLISPLLAIRGELYSLLPGSGWLHTVLDVLYYIFPKTQELLISGTSGFVLGEPVDLLSPILTTLAFIVVINGAAIAIFEKKDF